MKKQFLLIVFFVLAVFAGTLKSYGQTCTADALHPAAGVAYNYQTTVTGGFTGGGTYSWTVTTDDNIYAKTPPPAGLYTMIGNGTNSISVTWTAAAVSLAKSGTHIYLALWYSETASGTCTVENVRAIQIAPVNSFLLAITGVDAGGATKTTECAAPVVTAFVDHPANISAGEDNNSATTSMKIAYGTNTLTYKITASGVNANWQPSVRIPNLINNQTYASVEWGTSQSSLAPVSNFTAGTATGGTFTPTATDPAVSVAGTDYYLRLVINQNDYESLSSQVINVAVDGLLAPDYTVNDIKSTTDCTNEVPYGKNADITITARPTITPGVPPFMKKVPLP